MGPRYQTPQRGPIVRLQLCPRFMYCVFNKSRINNINTKIKIPDCKSVNQSYLSSQDSSVGSALDWYHGGREFECRFMLLGCMRDTGIVPI